MSRIGAPVIVPYDETWPLQAERLIAELRDALADPGAVFDHIGSTAVPGLAAKNIIDVQVRVAHLPSYEQLDATVGRLGFARAEGARPDSPGVFRDDRRGGEDVPDDVWEKRLYIHQDEPFAILHVRRLDSPFGRHTVWFRDWLRAHDAERDRYEALKRRLAREHAGDDDYDGYTRDKTGYLDQVQPEFERWAAAR